LRSAAAVVVTCALLGGLAVPSARAQEVVSRDQLEDALKAAWRKILTDSNAKSVVAGMKNDEDRRAFYAKQVDALLATNEAKAFQKLFEADRERYLERASIMAADQPALARSANAAATNPRRVGLLERSGIVDLISTALQGTNLVSANDTAVTVNLSAAALLCSACRDQNLPAATRYRSGNVLNRLGGSFTFGAKIPEKEIIGFSGLPSGDTLFDVVVWDAKVRLLGDRDPRSAHWDGMVLGELGGLENIRTMAAGDIQALPFDPLRDSTQWDPLHAAFNSVITQRSAQVADTIRRSLQVSVKFSGQHLTTQAGMNKYTGVLMADKGLGRFDGTLNVSYSAVQDVKIQPGATVTLKQWKATAGFVGAIWKGVFVADRAAELALSGEGFFPVDGSEVTVARKKTYKADLALKIPISGTLELPFSVTYTNDPNELAKKNYVTGRVGLTYDFGALKRLAQGK
jgi:hypothetical protein